MLFNVLRPDGDLQCEDVIVKLLSPFGGELMAGVPAEFLEGVELVNQEVADVEIDLVSAVSHKRVSVHRGTEINVLEWLNNLTVHPVVAGVAIREVCQPKLVDKARFILVGFGFVPCGENDAYANCVPALPDLAYHAALVTRAIPFRFFLVVKGAFALALTNVEHAPIGAQ